MKFDRYLLFAAIMAGIIFVADISVPLGVAFGVPYIMVVLVTLQRSSRRIVIITAIICTLLVLLGFALSPEGSEIWKVYINRAIGIFAIWFITLLGLITKEKEALLKQSETSLKAVNTYLDTIIKSEPECVKTVSKDGTLLSMNPAGLALIEAGSFGDVDGVSVYNLIAPEHRDDFIELNKRVFEGESAKLEYEIIGLKGERRWVETNATPLLDDSGNIISHLAVTRDITERKQAEKKLQLSEEKYRSIFETSQIGMALCEMDGTLIDINQGYLDIIGYSKEEILKLTYWDITPRDYEEKEEEQLRTLTETGRYGSYEKEYIHKDGRRVPVLLNGTLVTGEDGIERIWSLIQDITERKRGEEELLKLSRAVESSSSIVMITNLESNIEYINAKFTEVTGYTKEEVIGKNPRFLQSGETPEATYSDLWETVRAGNEWKGEFHNRKKDGSLYWGRNSISSVKNKKGELTHFIAIEDDVTHEYMLNEQLSYQASHDALTGLINRREFERRAERLLSTTKQDRDEHALCFMDLDQFKIVNDNCGHTAGDEMLRQLSMVLQHEVRKRDTLARLGGDEFGVLMEHCSLDHARRVATSLLKAIQDYQFLWEGQSFRVSASIGLVAITETTPNLTELLKMADAACYLAKDKGRNRIHVYYAEDAEVAQRHGEMQWVARIYKAMEEDHFCLYAQSILPLDGSTDTHYELLIRMEEAKGKLIPPGAFLPAAERYDLISKLDRWVIETAFRSLANNPAFFGQISFISINLSGQSLGEALILDFIITQLDESGIDGEKICFEITETAAISNLSTAIKFISTLKGLGCRFALDDFGSGLSSFAYLKNLPVDYLKIDGMFVKDIVDDPIDHAMVKSINEIGHVMGMQTIAEFVENDEIKGMLREIGVNYAQGYGIDKPMPFDELLARSSNVININERMDK
jgi:diguanylate cyclase (GGDEF)-like protein/PAS domain S-box-containing protein